MKIVEFGENVGNALLEQEAEGAALAAGQPCFGRVLLAAHSRGGQTPSPKPPLRDPEESGRARALLACPGV